MPARQKASAKAGKADLCVAEASRYGSGSAASLAFDPSQLGVLTVEPR